MCDFRKPSQRKAAGGANHHTADQIKQNKTTITTKVEQGKSLFGYYRNKGFAVIPRSNGQPAVKWKRYQNELPSYEDCARWDSGSYDYELVCGRVSNVVAIDIDTNDQPIIDAVIAAAGDSPVKRKGSKGLVLLYAYNGEKTHSWGKVELLSNRHLCAIPPGRHRETGMPYQWLGKALGEVNLPTIHDDFFKLYPYPAPPALLPSPPISGEGTYRSGYASKALQHAANNILNAPPGTRNNTLNREIWSLLRLASHGEMNAQYIANTLAAAALASGLPRSEVAATLTSALSARGIA